MKRRLKETGFALFFLGVIALVAVEAGETAVFDTVVQPIVSALTPVKDVLKN
jgi:6,7-dimethyl-8-ribityllumazine synthase